MKRLQYHSAMAGLAQFVSSCRIGNMAGKRTRLLESREVTKLGPKGPTLQAGAAGATFAGV